MKFILCLLLLLGHALALIYNKLSTQLANSLTSNDYLISTLGLMRVTLNPQTCQLQIENFTNNNYQIIGYYPRTSLPSCKSLSLLSNSLVSNNNNTLLSLKAADIKSVYDQIFVTIDEMGIIRINGISNKRFESSSENWISIFRNPQQFIYSISNLIVTLYSSLSFTQNTGNWGFSATNGVVRIFRINNVSKIIRYNYTGFTITPNNLYDYNTNALPQADFNQFKYYSMCSNRNYLQNFQGPFIFSINPYWPELRLLDRTGYQIISLRYPSPQCIEMLGVDFIQETDSCTSWFCPSNTFELNGDCLATCPIPYFHQIGKNGINRCILNCPQSFNKDTMKRICACSQIVNFQCPADLITTPFGCLCKGNTYFNPHNARYSPKNNYCFPSCGPFLFPHKSGICVPCPRYCQTCSLSSDSYAYLTCSYCTEGYLANSQGFCIKLTPNNTSVSCNKIQFCLTCSQSGNNCSSCQKPYSLYNNTCLTQCPKGFKSQFDQQKGFTCIVVPVCSSNSAIATSVNNQSKCFCFRNGNPSFARGCTPIQNTSCSLSSYFDSNTLECLSCPIGCLTCIQDSTSRIQCTSCEPDYSLFITVSRNNYCERNSIISICPNTYQYNTQICQLTTINQVIGTIKLRSDCLDKVSDCMMCVSGSNSCSVCNTDYYLHQGSCIKSCPSNTAPYRFQKVCLPRTQSNCLSQRTESAYWLFTKTFTNQNSQGYLYLLSANFQNVNYLNDPLGSLFIFLRNNDIQNKSKLVNIATSYQKCLVCEEGFGINASGSCQKCIFPCISCSFTSNKQSFCLKCDPYYRLNNQNNCEMLKVTELPCNSGQFRNESRMCQNDCLTFQRSNKFIMQQNKSYQINCTVNCPTNYQVLPYNNKNQVRLRCQQNAKNREQSRELSFLGSKHTLSKGSLYILASYSELTYIKSPSIEVQLLTNSNSRRLLQNNDNSISYYPTSFGIVVVDNLDSFKDNALIVKLYPANIASQYQGEKIYTSNSIYGFDKGTKQFIKIIEHETENLFFYGRIFTVLLFILTIIFLSNDINYKTDNIFITFSTIYLILPSLNLQPQNSLFNCYSLIYGFSWSSFLQFISNPRFITKTTDWFDGYIQLSHNNAHLLLFIDNNILRNCWSVFLTLIISLGILGTISIIMRCFSVYKIKDATKQTPSNSFKDLLYSWSKVGKSSMDFDHSRKVNNLLIFVIENSFISLIYYSLINILNSAWQLAPTHKQMIFKIISIAIAAIIFIYSCLRTRSNRIAGIYCFKRMGLGLALGLVTHLGGVDKNIAVGISLMIAIQIIFLFMRYRFQFITNYFSQLFSKQKRIRLSPNRIRSRHTIGGQLPPRQVNSSGSSLSSRQQTVQNRQAVQFWIMVIEQILIILVYIFGMLINTLGQVSALVVWIIANIFMINLGVDFVDLVIDYWNNTYNRASRGAQKIFKKIRNNWDHQLTDKSQTSTTNL